ncbi:transposase [Candidatus Dependentiae bacterium]|nr:transposase [Candidatus Dependentiae bacterium]MCC7414905.1 transposase [Campylobacterota bacterium]
MSSFSFVSQNTKRGAHFYEYRWSIEKFFRTAKQKLSLNDCQFRKQKLQENHLLNVLFAYALLQHERKQRKLKNVETAIERLKRLSFEGVKSHFMRSVQAFGVA